MIGRRTRGRDPWGGLALQGSFFVLGDGSTFLPSFASASWTSCNEMKGFIETAQKLVEAWDADPDNYSQLEEGLSALKAELEKFKD